MEDLVPDSAAPSPPKVVRTGDGFRSLGMQLGSIRRSNLASIAQVILNRGPVSRAEIAAAVGLSPGAVTKITAELLRAGFIVEGASRTTDRDLGRPRVPVTLDRAVYRFAGVHLGLRRTTVGLTDIGGDVVAQRVAEHRRRDPGSVLDEAQSLLAEVVAADGGTVLGAGVCAGGWVEPVSGIIRDHPVLGWSDVQLRDAAASLGVPVFVDSSVRALGLAEARFGAGRGSHNVVYAFVGNIVGAAQLLDGRVSIGCNAAAGTIDHLTVGPRSGSACNRGHADCLWALGSDVAVVAKARTEHVISTRHQLEHLVACSTRAGDPKARRATALLRERARYAGVAVGVLLDLFDPEIVVLGGGVLDAPSVLPALHKAAAERATRHDDVSDIVVPTGLGPYALVRGAASLALDQFYRDPLAVLAPSARG
jgi:predicted NBD/HSP70 family sugar kinase